MSTQILSFSIPSGATKANPFQPTIPINSSLLGIYSVTPNPVMLWRVDPAQQATFKPKYYWVSANGNPIFDDTQYIVDAASGASAATQLQLLVQDQS
jgi:hypothetical protein